MCTFLQGTKSEKKSIGKTVAKVLEIANVWFYVHIVTYEISVLTKV